MAALMESLTDEMDIPNLRDREDYASSTRRPATQEDSARQQSAAHSFNCGWECFWCAIHAFFGY